MFSDPEQIESPADERKPNLSLGGKEEIEFKLLADAKLLVRVRQAVATHKYVHGPSVHEDLVNQYYDTPDLQLRRAGLSLRVRWNGTIWVQSFKQKCESSNGVFRRREWERTISTCEPQLDDLTKLKLTTDATRIRRIFTTRFHRETFFLNIISQNAAQRPAAIRISLDEGDIEVGGRLLPIYEVEFELESGSETSLRLVGEEFLAQFGLKPGHLSKAERAYLVLRSLTPPEPI